MSITPALFPEIIDAIAKNIAEQADTITELDQILGDGDHVFNLQRGIQALQAVSQDISTLDWHAAWQKIGMTVMAAVGGASGSLYATLFLALHKNTVTTQNDITGFSSAFVQAIEAVKQRGKADVGEKTMLDVWAPVAKTLQDAVAAGLSIEEILTHVCATAEQGVEATRDMLATKGRASFLGERSLGHIDAGAKTAQLMIEAIANVISNHEFKSK